MLGACYQRWRRPWRWLGVAIAVVGVIGGGITTSRAEIAADDPLQSVMWPTVREALFAGQQTVFDNTVQVITAAKVENNMQVPVFIEVPASLGAVSEIVVFADYNPIPKIISYQPGTALPRLGFEMKVQEQTPIRAAARTSDGVWHIGGVWVDAAGGGCTTASLGQSSRLWETHLNETHYRRWVRPDGIERLAVTMIHPMDTGLAVGIPAFYLQHLTLRDQDGQVLAQVFPAEPVSENPVFTLDVRPAAPGAGTWRLEGRDSDGNELLVSLPPSPQEAKP